MPQCKSGASTGAGTSSLAASCPVASCNTLESFALLFLGARAERTGCEVAAAVPSAVSEALTSSLTALLSARELVHRTNRGGWSLKARRLSSGGSSGCRVSIRKRARAQMCCICRREAGRLSPVSDLARQVQDTAIIVSRDYECMLDQTAK